jgi:hypothetical protein
LDIHYTIVRSRFPAIKLYKVLHYNT